MILWLTPKKGISPAVRGLLTKAFLTHGIKSTDMLFASLHNKVPGLGNHTKRKMPDKADINAALSCLRTTIKQLDINLIVVNDESTIRAITGVKYALGTVRGSKYIFDGVPCIVVDNLDTLRYINHARFTLEFDLAKIIRHALGRTKAEPSFNFIQCNTVSDVRLHVERAKHATLLAHDTETSGGFITVESFTYDYDGFLWTCCVPYFNPFKENGCHWATLEEEIEVRKLLHEVRTSAVYKAFQNGSYDCAYYIKEGSWVENYFVDTQNLMHSMWVEAPKALHNIASYFLDCYTYWKDDKKGIEEDGWGKDTSGMEKYWRYNGLDTYYTWLGAAELLNYFRVTPWAAHNYNTELSLSLGPFLAGSLRGLSVDTDRHSQIIAEKSKEATAGIADLREMTGEVDFNPRSPDDNAWFLYDVLGAKKTRMQRKGGKYGPRSTDEKVLRLIEEQGNVIINNYIKRLKRYKEPAGVISNFGNLRRLCYRNGRFLAWHNAAGTDTGRANSSSGQFWTGRNAQNFQPELKEFCVADDDYVIVELDWSASDDYFIAHEAEETAKIELLLSGKDTHSYHASVFFSKNYDEIVKGKKQKAPWVTDAIKGVRQIAKKVVHGKNFMMGAGMMYNLMGREAVIATAEALGHERAMRYNDKELIGICQQLIDMYDDQRKGLYRRIRPWQGEAVEECARKGNLATCAFGMTRRFFGDVKNDHAKQRQLCAFYGQGGTAGNANRSLRHIFFSGIDDGRYVRFIFQVHDSLVFLIHRNYLHRITDIKNIMEQPTIVRGRQFFVPVNAKIGLTWSENMMDWSPATTYQEICAFEKATFEKKFPKGMAKTLDTLADLNFDADMLSSMEEELALFGEQDLEELLNGEPELASAEE